MVASARERAREADLLRFGLGEIEDVDPQPGEDLGLAAEESRLGFADTLRTAAEQARECLSAEDGGPDALGAVSAARKLLEGVREHDPEAAGLADRLAEISYLLSDVAADVASYASGLETDPARLAAVSERRAALAALTRKYGDTIDDVLAWSEHSAAAAARPRRHRRADRRADRAARPAPRASWPSVAAELTAARTKAAGRLGTVVTAELTSLAMPHAALTLAVTQTDDEQGLPVGERARCGSADRRRRRRAAAGRQPRRRAAAARQGRLRRRAVPGDARRRGRARRTNPVPTFVFDEVDAGVGGKAAVEVGRRLALLARHAQVLVVTHLPQVAAFADRHVVVRQEQRRHRHLVRADRARRRRPGPRAVPDARRARGLRHRAGPRRGAARGRAGVPRTSG